MELPNAHGDYDPLVGIDHIGLCEDFLLSMNGNTSNYVYANYDRQIKLQRPVFLAYEYVARRMHEITVSDTLAADTTQVAVFKSGVTLALGILEHMAVSIGVEVDDFYKYWETTSVVVLPPERNDQSEIDKVKAATSLVKEASERHLENLPDAYTELIRRAEVNYTQIQDRFEIFQMGAGYVLGSGYTALQYMYERRNIGEIDYDSILDWATENETPTHQSLADKFMRLIESGRGHEDSNLEAIFGRVMQDNVDCSEQLFEVLHALAIALYREEGQPGMDDTTEAFFNGANLGVHIATDIGQGRLGKAVFIERWLKGRLHRKLSKFGPDFHERARADVLSAFKKLTDTSTVPPEYARLLDVIDKEQDYDEEDSEAFRNGFHYALITLLNEVDSQKKGEAKKTGHA